MTSFAFPLLDELAFEQTIGAWQGIHDELAATFGGVVSSMHTSLGDWQGQGRTDFLRWWWGGDGTSRSGQGAEGDVQILLQVIDDIGSALNGYRASVADINGWLIRANAVVSANTDANGMFTLHRRGDPQPIHYTIVKGTMHPQGVGSLPYDCYLQVMIGFVPFPYTSGDGFETPAWFLEANRLAGQAVEAFNAACQACISRLGDIRSLAARVQWLKPYTQPAEEAGIGTVPGGDRAWEVMSGDMRTRPFPFGAQSVLGKVTYGKDGRPRLGYGGDPFDPSNVPSGYFSPDIFDKIASAVAGHALAILSVVLVGVGLAEGAAILDAFVDSSAFVSGIFEAVSGGSIVGATLSGYNLVVDSGAVDSVATRIAEDMLGHDSKLMSEFGDQLIGSIEQRLLEAPKVDGKYRVDLGTLTTPTAGANTGAYDSGYNSVVQPVATSESAGHHPVGVEPKG